ncbi:hypothetical protein [Robbsia andropogonis]|uniref:hypothetical protein n=1 Tax=Robbsia andropogonis TaxID=28092 RepID=UPI002A69C4D6|nr:hypothetical protein [Robbsia andropogonis]
MTRTVFRHIIESANVCGTESTGSYALMTHQAAQRPAAHGRCALPSGPETRARRTGARVKRKVSLRPKDCLLERSLRLRYAIERKLSCEWSPEQVSSWLKRRYTDDESMRVSHETIYRSLFVQARGVLKKELQYHLRTQRKMRHSRFSIRRRN